MNENVCLLKKQELDTLLKEHEVLTFATDYDFVYEKQIPPAAIVVIEGKLELIKRSKVVKEVSAGHLLGMKQLQEERPVKTGCRIKAGSRIILIPKSSLISA